MMAQTYEYCCSEKSCLARFTGTPAESVEVGWFCHRGTHPRYAYCPAHLPDWVEGWREKKRDEVRRRKEAEQRLAVEDRRRAIRGGVPDAWLDRLGTDLDAFGRVLLPFWEDLKARAWALGGVCDSVSPDDHLGRIEFSFSFLDEDSSVRFNDYLLEALLVAAFPEVEDRDFWIEARHVRTRRSLGPVGSGETGLKKSLTH